jgi:hypothetical protein
MDVKKDFFEKLAELLGKMEYGVEFNKVKIEPDNKTEEREASESAKPENRGA